MQSRRERIDTNIVFIMRSRKIPPLIIMDSRKRLDLSEWVIHFVHERKPENDPNCFVSDLAEEKYWCAYKAFEEKTQKDRIENGLQPLDDDTLYDMFCESNKDVPTPEDIGSSDLRLPDYYDKSGEGKNILSPYEENEYEIEEDASPFSVLKKILHDGYIHSSWSIRNYTPSIYGPKSAVCFTEMPLYALIDYAKTRSKKDGLVSGYGIAFRRKELFDAGGRPVIYGLSGDYAETDNDENGVCQGRLLAKECGIGITEQYRYVSTILHKGYGKTVDWTHEREWRWPLPYDTVGVPGIPFFLAPQYASYFSEVIVIVCTDEEKEEITEFLKNLYDSGSTNVGMTYNTDVIADTKVISLETIARMKNIDIHTMKIEDLSSEVMNKIPLYEVTDELLEKVRKAVIQAGDIAVDATKQYLNNHKDFDQQKGYYGWAHVCTTKVGEVTEALKRLKMAKTYSDGIYYLSIKEYQTLNLELLEIGSEAASKYLSQELGQYFFVKSVLD